MIAILILNLLTSFNAKAGYEVIAPYVKHDGTFVQGHIRTTPDSNTWNNLNPPVNPYNNPSNSFNTNLNTNPYLIDGN